jgi:hypothetical protein
MRLSHANLLPGKRKPLQTIVQCRENASEESAYATSRVETAMVLVAHASPVMITPTSNIVMAKEVADFKVVCVQVRHSPLLSIRFEPLSHAMHSRPFHSRHSSTVFSIDASPNQPSTYFLRAIPGTVLAYNKICWDDFPCSTLSHTDISSTAFYSLLSEILSQETLV